MLACLYSHSGCSSVTLCPISQLTLKVQPIFVALLAIAPSPHFPQVVEISEADGVPTSLHMQGQTRATLVNLQSSRSIRWSDRLTSTTYVQGRPHTKARCPATAKSKQNHRSDLWQFMRCVAVAGQKVHTLHRLCADEHHQHQYRRNQPSPFVVYRAHLSSQRYIKNVASQPSAVRLKIVFGRTARLLDCQASFFLGTLPWKDPWQNH